MNIDDILEEINNSYHSMYFNSHKRRKLHDDLQEIVDEINAGWFGDPK